MLKKLNYLIGVLSFVTIVTSGYFLAQAGTRLEIMMCILALWAGAIEANIFIHIHNKLNP
jgi:hypothetical protein